MKKLFKFLLWLLAIVIVLVVVAYLTAGIWVKAIFSTLVPQMTKTPAVLQEADISLLSGKIALKGLKIGNPVGFAKPNAFELGEVSVKFDPKSLFTSKIIINEIKIDGTKVDAELAKSGNMNLMLLNNNVQEYLGKPTFNNGLTNEQKAPKKSAAQSGKAVLVKDLSITNSSLDFAFMSKTMTVSLPDIHEKNIGEQKKETLPELIAGIFEKLITESYTTISKATKESVNKVLDDLAGRSKEAAGLVQGLKNFF